MALKFVPIMNFASMIPARALVVFGFALLLTGCSKTPSWFSGTYEFDAEESLKPLVEKSKSRDSKEPKPKEDVVGAFKELAVTLAPLALAQKFHRVTIAITDKEIISTKGGTGTVVRYEVYQRPDRDTIVIKTSENKIETWRRTPAGIAQKGDGDIDLWIPFKRKDS